MNLCSKPSCTRPGAVVLSYDYAQGKALIDDPEDGQLSPHVYVLCIPCAERLRPPRGWKLEDRRSKPPLFVDPVTGPVVVSMPAADLDEAGAAEPRRQLFFGYSA